MAKLVHSFLYVFLLFALAAFISAYDPGILQDFCVADDKSNVFVNGKACKDPSTVTIDDFIYRGIDKPGNTTNYLGTNVTLINVDALPGLNTLGISMGRIDFAPHGLNPPHTHNRASELFVVLEGTLYAGFITNNPDHKLYAKILKKGDMICFPFGLIHFQLNIGNTSALGFAMLTSQNPGVQHIGQALFGSDPSLEYKDVLTSAFQMNKKTVEEIMARFKVIDAAISVFHYNYV